MYELTYSIVQINRMSQNNQHVFLTLYHIPFRIANSNKLFTIYR